MSERCRCGHDGRQNTDHPCHGNGYACRKPAQRCFVVANPTQSLAGMQLKFGAYSTWACDECWEMYRKARGEV